MKCNNNSNFHSRLRELLSGRVAEWAKKLKMSETNIRTNYINGDSYPCADKIILMAENGVDVAWLITGEKTYQFEQNALFSKNVIADYEFLLDFSSRVNDLHKSGLDEEQALEVLTECFGAYLKRAIFIKKQANK